MADYLPDISIDNVIDALAAFVLPFMGTGGQVVRAQVNRVPMPADPVAVLTELLEKDLEVPYGVNDSTNQKTDLNGPTQIDVQIDFYGVNAGSQCKAVKAAFRSEWGFYQFPTNIKPLYTSDGNQTPLVTGEEQYESRWTMTVSMQYNPLVSVPQQSADALAVHEIIVI